MSVYAYFNQQLHYNYYKAFVLIWFGHNKAIIRLGFYVFYSSFFFESLKFGHNECLLVSFSSIGFQIGDSVV